jgi:hypothetical protein
MSAFRMNKFSSIETSTHVAPANDYEVLEWPRPILSPPLTHVSLTRNTNKTLIHPVLMGEYEDFSQAKGKFNEWLGLLEVTQENQDEIKQATVALSSVIENFGYKTSKNSLKNWASSLEKNWPEKGPNQNLRSFNEKLNKSEFIEKISPEFGIFWEKGEKSLSFRLVHELKIFFKNSWKKEHFMTILQQLQEYAGWHEKKWECGHAFG